MSESLISSYDLAEMMNRHCLSKGKCGLVTNAMVRSYFKNCYGSRAFESIPKGEIERKPAVAIKTILLNRGQALAIVRVRRSVSLETLTIELDEFLARDAGSQTKYGLKDLSKTPIAEAIIEAVDNAPEVINPLMQMVRYNERDYFTSHYFHAVYKGNLGQKYDTISNFNQAIKNIETYQQYVELGDIVELVWKDSGKKTGIENLIPLFKSNSYNPIMLLSATAQVAMTHHLDDEISKRASVNVNQNAAAEKPTFEFLIDFDKGKLAIDKAKEMFLALGISSPTLEQLVAAANKATGQDFSFMLEGVRDVVKDTYEIEPLSKEDLKIIQSERPDEDYLTPTEIGKIVRRLHGIKMSPQNVNDYLEREGYQIKKEGGDWTVLPKGLPFARRVYQSVDTPMGEVAHVRWLEEVIEEMDLGRINDELQKYGTLSAKSIKLKSVN